jgi:3-hydroxyisobutyrate dehydrogenase-like beta-hydroxyacid dehydrogenase
LGKAAPGSGPPLQRKKPAKSTILFFLCGGASHIDMWDMKPDAPVEYRGEFSPSFTLEMARKDVGLMMDAAGERSLPVLGAVAARMDESLAAGNALKDYAVFGVDASKA